MITKLQTTYPISFEISTSLQIKLSFNNSTNVICCFPPMALLNQMPLFHHAFPGVVHPIPFCHGKPGGGKRLRSGRLSS